MHVVFWIESGRKLQVDVEPRYSGASSVEARCDRPYLTGIEYVQSSDQEEIS